MQELLDELNMDVRQYAKLKACAQDIVDRGWMPILVMIDKDRAEKKAVMDGEFWAIVRCLALHVLTTVILMTYV